MFASIANTFANCFKIPELKTRIFFTLMVLAICRLISMIPIPGLDGAAFQEFITLQAQDNQGGSLLGMYSLFTGGALERCAVGSLGIMPYISATIIIQLLTAVLPQLSKLSREEGGRTKIIQYGRFGTIILCVGQGLVMAMGFENPQKIFGAECPDLVLYGEDMIWWYRIQTMIVLTCGTALLMWLGEQITDRGIGNGISLIITIGILARLPDAGQQLADMFMPGDDIESSRNMFEAIFLIILFVAVTAAIVAVTQAQRKIPVQYAQRSVGRKVYAGGSSFMPLRVNYAGVMPIIFAQAILMIPGQVFGMIGSNFDLEWLQNFSAKFQEGNFLYVVTYSFMILAFSYFWVATQFNELQISDDLKKNGGYIPGVRPGQQTCDFLHRTMSRITLAGAVFLMIIAVVPMIITRFMEVPYQAASFFGGTSLLIMVGVLLDTMRQMESHLLMRHYDGFLKKGRIKGRF